MKKLFTLLILSFFFSFNFMVQANEVSVEDFALDLNEILGFDNKRTLEVANSVNLFVQLSPFATTAEASYNPLLKTMFLKLENLNIETCENFLPSFKVKSIRQLKSELPLTYSIKTATIFHELGHAEMAEYILKGIDEDDQVLLDLYLNEFKPWAKKNFPDVKAKDIFQEYYGYFRTSIIETLFKDMLEIESFNGLDRFHPVCASMNYYKRNALHKTKEEFIEQTSTSNAPEWTKPYYEIFYPKYIFIKGKDVNLDKNPNDPFKKSWKKKFWNYFSKKYHVPYFNKASFANFLNTHGEYASLIKKCKEKAWEEIP